MHIHHTRYTNTLMHGSRTHISIQCMNLYISAFAQKPMYALCYIHMYTQTHRNTRPTDRHSFGMRSFTFIELADCVFTYSVLYLCWFPFCVRMPEPNVGFWKEKAILPFVNVRIVEVVTLNPQHNRMYGSHIAHARIHLMRTFELNKCMVYRWGIHTFTWCLSSWKWIRAGCSKKRRAAVVHGVADLAIAKVYTEIKRSV